VACPTNGIWIMANIPVDSKSIKLFCHRWGISELAFFGSALQKDFHPDSDVEVLVRFHPEAEPSLFDMVQMQEELEMILGRKVDLVSRRAIESSRNHLRKNDILSAAEVVYEAT